MKKILCTMLCLTMLFGASATVSAASSPIPHNYKVSTNWNTGWNTNWNMRWNWNSGVSQTKKAPELTLVSNSISDTSRSIKVEWSKVDGAVQYEIQRSSDPSFDDAHTSKTKDLSYNYRIFGTTGVYYHPAHVNYYFRVRANLGCSYTEWSDVLVAKGNK